MSVTETGRDRIDTQTGQDDIITVRTRRPDIWWLLKRIPYLRYSFYNTTMENAGVPLTGIIVELLGYPTGSFRNMGSRIPQKHPGPGS